MIADTSPVGRVATFIFSGLPVVFRFIQEHQGSHHIGLNKNLRIFNTAINMGFGSKVDDCVKIVLIKKIFDKGTVDNIPFDKDVIGVVFNIS